MLTGKFNEGDVVQLTSNPTIKYRFISEDTGIATVLNANAEEIKIPMVDLTKHKYLDITEIF